MIPLQRWRRDFQFQTSTPSNSSNQQNARRRESTKRAHISRLDLNPSHNSSRRPIIKHDETHPLHTKQRPPENSIRRIINFHQPRSLLEILVDLDFGSGFSHGVGV